MKILKLNKTLFFFLFILTSISAAAKDIPSFIYNDTILTFEKFTVEIKETYVKKNLWLRTTVVIHNKCDQYLIFNPKEILFTTEKLFDTQSLYSKLIVIPPNYIKSFYLKFSGKDSKSTFVSFDFTKIRVSQNAELIQINKNIRAESGYRFRNDKISFRVAGYKVLPQEFEVVVKLKYKETKLKEDKFLAINFNNIGLISEKTDTCYNLKKGIEKFNYEQGVRRETYKLVFAKNCVKKVSNKKVLLFQNVFTEYTLKDTEGFKIRLRAVSQSESLKNHKTKKDIEQIE